MGSFRVRYRPSKAKLPETAVAGRYHLYVSLAYPWACRYLMVRKLRKRDHIIPVSVVDLLSIKEHRREFTNYPGNVLDYVNQKQLLREAEFHRESGSPGVVGQCEIDYSQ